MITSSDTGGVAVVSINSAAARRDRVLARAERLFIAAMQTEGLRLASREDADRMARAAFERARQFEDVADSMPEARS